MQTIKSLCLWKYYMPITNAAYKNRNRRIKNIAMNNISNTTFSDIMLCDKYTFQKSKQYRQKYKNNIKQYARHVNKINEPRPRLREMRYYE